MFTAPPTVKYATVQSWDNCGHKRDSSYCQANKVFWQTIPRFHGKRSRTARPIKVKNDVLLSNEKIIFARWIEYFKDLSNSVTTTPLDINQVHLGEENSITAADFFLVQWFST